MSRAGRPIYEFGQFRLDVERSTLSRDGEPVPITPRAADVLTLLVQNRGTLLERDSLMQAVWKDTFVEDANLTVAVSQLRKALGQTRNSNTFIETVPKVGYRFVAEVQEAEVTAPALVIEKHTYSQTILEEQDEIETTPEATRLPAARRILRPSVLLAALTTLIAALAVSTQGRGETTAPGAQFKSMAVLPLRVLAASGGDNSLGLGVSETLIARLGRLKHLRVLSANTMSQYRDDTREPNVIGKELGVDAVMTGSIQQGDRRLRVLLRVIRVSDGRQLWDGSVDATSDDVFALQDQVALRVENGLALDFGLRTPVTGMTQNPEAYRQYLQGHYLLRRREGAATGFLARAVARDPTFARAWAWLALSHAMGASFETAQATVDTALALAPDLAEAHAVDGFIKMFLERNWPAAERSLVRAVELDPNLVEGHQWLGLYLASAGRFDEATVEMHRALNLDPASHNLTGDLGQVRYYARDYAEADHLFQQANVLSRGSHQGLRLELLRTMGRYREAYQLGFELECGGPVPIPSSCASVKSREAEWARPLEVERSMRQDSLAQITSGKVTGTALAQQWYLVATASVSLGESRRAAEALLNLIQVRPKYDILSFSLPFAAVDPQWSTLQGEPAFREALRQLGLPHRPSLLSPALRSGRPF